MTRIGVVVFPGSNCDLDTLRGLELAGAEAVPLWHEQGSLDGSAAVVLPGGSTRLARRSSESSASPWENGGISDPVRVNEGTRLKWLI